MSKELEALKIGIPKLKKLYENSAKKMSQNDILGFDLVFVYLDKALQSLESIENSNPSEAVECLKKINNYLNDVYDYKEIKEQVQKDINTVKQALLKSQEQEKVLRIVFEKRIDIESFYTTFIQDDFPYSYYFLNYGTYGKDKLTQQEFELLKRYFNDRT